MDAVKFNIGQEVFHASGFEKPGMVTGILYRPNGIIYLVTWANDLLERYHYEIEIKADQDFKLKD